MVEEELYLWIAFVAAHVLPQRGVLKEHLAVGADDVKHSVALPYVLRHEVDGLGQLKVLGIEHIGGYESAPFVAQEIVELCQCACVFGIIARHDGMLREMHSCPGRWHAGNQEVEFS